MLKEAKSDSEIEKCFDVMSQLRAHLNRDEFLETVRIMEKEGFRLAYLEDENEVVAVAGYRITTNLAMGKNLYIDDLVTSERVRSKGYGEIMVNWLREKAKQADCSVFYLGSGISRAQAHKFYLNQGFKITAYAFCEQLEG